MPVTSSVQDVVKYTEYQYNMVSVDALQGIHKWMKCGKYDAKQNTGIAHAFIHLRTR